jgi:hypothetical protein
VVPAEVDLGALPPGQWVDVTITLSNPTDRDVTVFDLAPT